MTSNLTKGQVRAVSKALRTAGRKLPGVGRCTLFRASPGSSKRVVAWPTDRYVAEVCHDARGYYFVRSTSAFDGLRRRKRRSRR